MALTALPCVFMAFVETALQPVYGVKCAIRAAVFLGAILLWMALCRDTAPLKAFRRPGRGEMTPALLLAACALAVILSGCALLSPWLDLSGIPGVVGGQEGITSEVYLLVAFYVTFLNSILEEFFFRAFAFQALRQFIPTPAAGLFSSLAFALYHVSILDGWFAPPVFLLLTVGLALAGGLFCLLDRKGGIWPGWTVHMAADAALNLIGMRLFGIL